MGDVVSILSVVMSGAGSLRSSFSGSVVLLKGGIRGVRDEYVGSSEERRGALVRGIGGRVGTLEAARGDSVAVSSLGRCLDEKRTSVDAGCGEVRTRRLRGISVGQQRVGATFSSLEQRVVSSLGGICGKNRDCCTSCFGGLCRASGTSVSL